MKRKSFNYSFVFLLLAGWGVLLTACGEESKATEEGVEAVAPTEETVSVETTVLAKGVFHHELVSNGKLTTRHVADLYFQTAEVIAEVRVKSGDRVAKGEKIASLDLFRLSNRRQQAADALERAKLDLQDVLIGQGYGVADSARVPAATLRLAEVKSGYSQSKAQYELACFEEANGLLTAPFAGTIANLNLKPYNKASTAEPFCRLVDTENMEVDFTILESELPLIKVSDRVQITPYADLTVAVEGVISLINPLVETNGMVKVKASVQRNNRLFEGGNVRVNVRRSIDGKWVVPKSAVVMRSGKQVLFTFKEGRAYWNYVQVELENATQYVIIGETLQEGDLVIISNNINLAHETPVTVSNREN